MASSGNSCRIVSNHADCIVIVISYYVGSNERQQKAGGLYVLAQWAIYMSWVQMGKSE
jgi:hypothetical protein